ncbi:RTA1 like protein-domain-containing protein [Rhodofomes roseus]|uniref:RTA1 like protein-domain-containing protein n=1 Tax=Rhodofomes roseus TaxID=34475 RepID=A0ABQ8KVM6_9APHY|nr:RTA1 like protein-domain-containing protein [Rhodofomes roseus]KAH9843096.1 RTA1 like protein-domain-containing protein [Rhodofomes roseus]
MPVCPTCANPGGNSLGYAGSVQISPYGYTPTAWVGILMVVLFVLTTVLHFFQALRYRMWFLAGTAVVAGILEAVGWVGRLWASYDVLSHMAFSMQIICTIIGPTPLIAANFIILGHVIRRLGQQYSRLSARRYTIVFVSCDIISLIVQALGGAAAAAAVNNNKSPKGGSDIMLAGIIFQTGESHISMWPLVLTHCLLVAITFYVVLAAEFFLRCFKDWPIRGRAVIKTGYVFESKMQQMVAALVFSTSGNNPPENYRKH